MVMVRTFEYNQDLSTRKMGARQLRNFIRKNEQVRDVTVGVSAGSLAFTVIQARRASDHASKGNKAKAVGHVALAAAGASVTALTSSMVIAIQNSTTQLRRKLQNRWE